MYKNDDSGVALSPSEAGTSSVIPLRFEIIGYHVALDLAPVCFLSAIVIFAIWYLENARSASIDTQNLLLIQPIVICICILYPFALFDSIKISRAGQPNLRSKREPLSRTFRIRIIGSMLLLSGYVLSIQAGGFDVATFLYLFAWQVILGERRPTVLILVPLIFTAVIILSFKTLVSFPLPVTFGGAR